MIINNRELFPDRRPISLHWWKHLPPPSTRQSCKRCFWYFIFSLNRLVTTGHIISYITYKCLYWLQHSKLPPITLLPLYLCHTAPLWASNNILIVIPSILMMFGIFTMDCRRWLKGQLKSRRSFETLKEQVRFLQRAPNLIRILPSH